LHQRRFRLRRWCLRLFPSPRHRHPNPFAIPVTAPVKKRVVVAAAPVAVVPVAKDEPPPPPQPAPEPVKQPEPVAIVEPASPAPVRELQQRPMILRPDRDARPEMVPNTVVMQPGTTLDVRLSESLSSKKNQTGDTFFATLDQPLVIDGYVIAERGARAEGRITDVENAKGRDG